MLNANAFHNVMNVAVMVLAAATAALLATGCTVAGETIECSKSWIDPTYAVEGIAVISFLKLIINIFRDGLSGLFKVQPPVQK